MRYFVYDDERLDGPFTPEELEARPGFGRATLVYPEESLDQDDVRWRAAGDVPSLALALDVRERARFAQSCLPPQPQVRDLPVLGAILDDVDRLSGVVIGMRAELGQHEAEQQSLTDEDRAGKARDARLEESVAALDARLGALEPVVADVAALRERLGRAEDAHAALAREAREAVAALQERAAAAEAAATELEARLEDAERERARLAVVVGDAKTGLAALDAKAAEAEARAAALDAELAALRAREEARWRLGRKELSPRGLLAGLAGAAVLAVAALVLALLRPKPAPPPPPAAPVVTAVPPAPKSAPPPKPKARHRPKPRPRPRPTPAQAAVAAHIRETILLRTTGGVISDKENVDAMDLVKSFPARATGAPCPRSVDDLRSGGGSPPATPEQAARCWTWRRAADDLDALAAAKKMPRAQALGLLETDAAGWGGFERLLPVDASAQRTSGQVFVVGLRASDLLAVKLHERYGFGPAQAPAQALRFEVDLSARTVRPITPASWSALDPQGAAKAGPGAAAPAYRHP